MVTYTTTYNLAKPTVGDDEDVWGGYLNGNFDTLESLLKGTTALTAINVTGNITVGGTVDGRDIAADGTKLDNIESGATADQTASEILTAIKTVDGSGSGLDADTLDGQEGSYYLNTSTTFGGDVSGTYDAIVVANDSHTHDGRYYTETEADSRFVLANQNNLQLIPNIGFFTNDGGGNLGIRFNADVGSATNYSIEDGSAWEFQFNNDTTSGDFVIYRDVSISAAGEAITWEEAFKLEGTDTEGYLYGNKIWHAGNDGSGSGLDADTLDGYEPSTGTTSTSSANTIVLRNGSGDFSSRYGFFSYLNMTHASNTRSSDTVFYSSTDNYIRKNNATGFKTSLGLSSTDSPTFNAPSVTDLYVDDQIISTGDTNTYFQFHAADKARVVCNGGVSMEWGSNYARMFDNDSLYFGSGSDFRIYHDGTNNVIKNQNHAAGDIYIQGEDTSGVNHTMAIFYSSNAAPYVGLRYDNVEVFTTVSGGVNVNGNINAVDNIYLASTIYHEGDTDTYIDFDTNQINFVTGGATEMQINGDGVFLNGAALHEEYVALSGTTPTCDPNSGGGFSLTLSGNTTFTFGGTTASWSTGFIVELTGNATTAYTVTWPTSVDWAGGTAPDAPAVGETDIYVFWTRDGGTTWYGVQSIDAAA